MNFEIIQGNIALSEDMVIVNASNTNLFLGSGVSGAIKKEAGPNFQDFLTNELEKKGGTILPGEVLTTTSNNELKAKYIFHAAVMDYRDIKDKSIAPDEKRIRDCCQNIWQKIVELQENNISISLVALGAGAGDFGTKMSWQIICDSLKDFLKDPTSKQLSKVSFYAYSTPDVLVAYKVIPNYFDIKVPKEFKELIV